MSETESGDAGRFSDGTGAVGVSGDRAGGEKNRWRMAVYKIPEKFCAGITKCC